MIYSVYSLFPNLIEPWTTEAILGRAVSSGKISFNIKDLRFHANNKWNKVDDSPYGGGAGMVIKADVTARALDEVKAVTPAPDELILLSPAGEPFTQALAEELAAKKHLALFCGRYEGFDARVEPLFTREISVGDYVLMGGEIAALTLIEATARLIPGVLGDEASHKEDSFSTGLLDYPEYTRPAEFMGIKAPKILSSGHHAKVALWRRQQALKRTLERRPDLLLNLNLSNEDKSYLESLKEKKS